MNDNQHARRLADDSRRAILAPLPLRDEDGEAGGKEGCRHIGEKGLPSRFAHQAAVGARQAEEQLCRNGAAALRLGSTAQSRWTGGARGEGEAKGKQDGAQGQKSLRSDDTLIAEARASRPGPYDTRMSAEPTQSPRPG
jgi:hypothetical protein